MPFRLGLGVFVVDALLGRLFRGVLPVPPGHPGLDLFQADIPAVNKNDTHLAPVVVDLAAIRFGGAVERQRGQARLGLFAKGLFFSGASMPAIRILCGICSTPSRVSVSPSLTPMIRPVSVSAGAWAEITRRKSNMNKR